MELNAVDLADVRLEGAERPDRDAERARQPAVGIGQVRLRLLDVRRLPLRPWLGRAEPSNGRRMW